MTFDFYYFRNKPETYMSVTKYYPQVPVTLFFKNTTTATNANEWRLTFRWYEYNSHSSGSGSTMHEVVRSSVVTEGTRTTGNWEESILESDFGDITLVMGDYPYNAFCKFEWLHGSTVLESNSFRFSIYGQNGTVNWNYQMPNPYSTTYPLINQSFTINSQLIDYVNSSSGSPIVWRETYNGIDANEWAVPIIEVPYYGSRMVFTFAQAASEGYLASQSKTISFVDDNTKKINGKFYANLYANGINYSGQYRIGLRYYDHNSSGTYSHEIWGDYFNVYTPFTGAAFHISSIVPAKYQDGSSDPLNGMPPFTVTVADDTQSRRGGYTIPLDYITIDWDDPQSESPSWTVSNPGSSSITIPPHVYNDSRTHNIQMICKDKLGNVSTAEVKFSPSQEPRIISAPKLNNTSSGSTISLSYPALMKGEAFNAGSPMPETTWTYSLQSDPGYYSGTRIGDYVEFSLLAEGRYTITATIKNGSVTLGTYTWTVNVGAETVSTAADKQMPDYALIVLDAAGQPLDYCKQHSCPNYVENFQSLDTVSFELPADYTYADRLKEGDYFLFGMGGARLMQVSYRAQKGKTLTITGECVFPQRVAIYATRSTAADGYDVQTCSAEALIRYFVHTALSDPYNSQPRSADFWMHNTNQDLPTNGAQVTYSARYENILDIINSVCKTSGIGYSIAVRDVSGAPTSVQMTVKEGTNRTYATGGTGAVIFSEKLKNCLIDSDQSAVSSNVAIGAGAGAGYIREYSYYDKDGNTNPPMTGFARREVFVDAGDSADSSEQKRMSVYQLREEQALSISLQVLPTCQWKYGTDYAVGDTVSVWLDSRGGLVDLQIYSADHVKRESGEELHLHLGSRVQTAPALIASNERKNTYARK